MLVFLRSWQHFLMHISEELNSMQHFCWQALRVAGRKAAPDRGVVQRLVFAHSCEADQQAAFLLAASKVARQAGSK